MSGFPMKLPLPSDPQAQFSTKVRYYHRTGQSSQRTWDDWVEGAGGKDRVKKRGRKNWLAIILSIMGLIVLAGIIIGLFVELM